MIAFMIIAAPRSATTWAANWLTTDGTLCLHDPLWRYHYRQLDAIESRKMLGVCCTGLAHFPEWVNAHPARKVILHRDPAEVSASLSAIGIRAPTEHLYTGLDEIRGMHVDWRELFTNPRPIYEHLLELPFDAERHAELAQMEIQPHFTGLKKSPEVTRQLLDEMRAFL